MNDIGIDEGLGELSNQSLQGEIAALSAAAFWAIASVVYGRVGVIIPPLFLNLLKGIVAIAFLVVTIFLSGDAFPTLSVQPLVFVFISGVVGIGLGDTIFFAAINALGPRRALLMGTLAPPITAILAFFFLNEQLQIRAWWGILLTIIGVAWVITERTTSNVLQNYSRLIRGTILGLLAAITNSIGAVLARTAFSYASMENSTISPLWAALLRLSAGVLSLLLWTVIFSRKQKFPTVTEISQPKILGAIALAAFFGTYLGIWLQQTAIKLTLAGIAQTLMQTSPIFILPFARFAGEKISFRAIAGVLVAIAGIALLFYLNQT